MSMALLNILLLLQISVNVVQMRETNTQKQSVYVKKIMFIMSRKMPFFRSDTEIGSIVLWLRKGASHVREKKPNQTITAIESITKEYCVWMWSTTAWALVPFDILRISCFLMSNINDAHLIQRIFTNHIDFVTEIGEEPPINSSLFNQSKNWSVAKRLFHWKFGSNRERKRKKDPEQESVRCCWDCENDKANE